MHERTARKKLSVGTRIIYNDPYTSNRPPVCGTVKGRSVSGFYVEWDYNDAGWPPQKGWIDYSKAKNIQFSL